MNFTGPFTVSYVTCPPAGCLNTVPIEIRDTHVSMPSIKASYNLDENARHAVEFGLVTAQGSGSQSIASGDQIYLNSQIAGPQQVKSNFDLTVADLMYRWRHFLVEDSLATDLLAGLNYSTLNLNVSTPMQSASGSYGDLALQIGGGVMWRWHTGTSLQARTFYSSKGDGWGHTNTIWRNELMLQQSLHRTITLSAGYASWKVNGQSSDTSGVDATPSEFKLNFSGPMFRLDWNINPN